MEENKSEVQESLGGISYKEMEENMGTPDVHSVGVKIERAREIYKAYAGVEEKPAKSEVLGWYFYGLCSYFVHTVLIPIVFPLIISQTVSDPPEPPQGWSKNYMGLKCKQNQTRLYEGLIHRSISNSSFSPLEWTSISWAGGLIFSAPILGILSILLDYGHNQQLIAGVAIAVGAIFCLPAGFVQKSWIFPPYVAAIVVANTIGAAAHARHLGLMIRGHIGLTIRKSQFPDRKTFASWLSLYSTASGCLGAAILSSFMYYMLRKSDHFTALWVVSIFSGLTWGLGMAHIFSTNRFTSSSTTSSSSNSIPKTHVISIFKYPHAAGSLVGVFLSSFTTMCIFAAGVLYATGYLCVKPVTLLYLWLTYFMFPLVSLPLAHPLQQLIQADAVKMQLLGFSLSILTSGFGFYYRQDNWHKHHLLVFTGIHSTATGLLHAFGRVLWLDCSPAGKEGAFSVWFSWVRALGTCAGFALATALPGNIGKAFGTAFCAGIVGMVILIFGNISSFGGAKAAGHVIKSEKASPVHGLDNGGAADVDVKAAPGTVDV
ncbi:unnamed protein product [Fraxinus pennsylvanica]|uniref:Uncharacterized protein n=1 Tax=Fraxinus pennsylvanica TaxID=56036 RepID=A0AAD1ZRT1_9LAMI|nr:unnamed protein product [Fraxinus pennsylvanica]